MEKYIIKVNGKEYEVEVEKVSSGVQAEAPAPQAPAAPQTPAPAPKTAGPMADGVKLEAGAAGKVFKIVKKAGESVAKGETIIILEAMKMEIPMVATADGVIKEILISEGQPVEAGDLLAVIG
ncbi:MAG: biotin/lipoyl-binding protein [Firmicutes bacterium]|nr:biotin/lipoyl-binding protein [Bacillota bacterium]